MQHLAACPECRNRLNALLEAESLLHIAPDESPEPGFADRVMSRLALQVVAAPAPVQTKRTVAVALAVVSAAVVAVGCIVACSTAVLALSPGRALIIGLPGAAASLANLMVVMDAIAQSVVAAVHALPAELLAAVAYTLVLCCSLAALSMILVLVRSGKASRAALP